MYFEPRVEDSANISNDFPWPVFPYFPQGPSAGKCAAWFPRREGLDPRVRILIQEMINSDSIRDVRDDRDKIKRLHNLTLSF